MGLFSKKTKIEENIFDLLKTDIKKFNEDDFLFLENEKDEHTGEEKTRYVKRLLTFECDLFDKLEVIVFSEHEANFIFNTEHPFNIDKVRELVNRLHGIYGIDYLKNNSFEHRDVYFIQTLKAWTGRMWTEASPEVCMSYSGIGGLTLSVLGVHINE